MRLWLVGGKNRHSDCAHTPEFIQQLQEYVMKTQVSEYGLWCGKWVFQFPPCSWPWMRTSTASHTRSVNVNFFQKKLNKTVWQWTSCWTRDNLVFLWWIFIRASCITARTTNDLPTIYMMFLMSWRPSFLKLWWLLGVSPVRVMSCHLTSLNTVAGSIKMELLVKAWLERVAAGCPEFT